MWRGLHMSCHFQCWLTVTLCGWGADTDSQYGRQPAWGIPFGGALCAKFIQTCSIVGEQIMNRQIMNRQISLVSMLIPQCSLRQLSGCLDLKPCLPSHMMLWLIVDVCCLATRGISTRSAQILRWSFSDSQSHLDIGVNQPTWLIQVSITLWVQGNMEKRLEQSTIEAEKSSREKQLNFYFIILSNYENLHIYCRKLQNNIKK